MSVVRRNFKKGFTLVELLVTITIFVVLTGVVLFNQSRFNSTILLTNLAYDTALTIRQAQTYGINIKEFDNGSGTGNFVPYGVHFDMSANKSFILFADLSYDQNTKSSDGLYNNTGSYDVPNLFKCETNMGCVARYNIKRGNYIYDLCTNNETNCGYSNLDVVFTRPNPEAQIRMNNEDTTQTSNATIILRGTDGSERKVRVGANGLIEILNN